jgi:hypothetical protein
MINFILNNFEEYFKLNKKILFHDLLAYLHVANIVQFTLVDYNNC